MPKGDTGEEAEDDGDWEEGIDGQGQTWWAAAMLSRMLESLI